MMPITATIDPILMIGPHEIETFAGAEVSRPCTFRPATLVRTDFPKAGHCTYRPAFSSATIIRFPHVQLMRIAMAILSLEALKLRIAGNAHAKRKWSHGESNPDLLNAIQPSSR